MSHELWFLWLFLGLKIPLLGLFYFIFRVLRAQDKAWEQGEFDGGATTTTAAAASRASSRRRRPAVRASGGASRARRRRSRPLRGLPLRRAAATPRRAAAHARPAAAARAHELKRALGFER